MHYRFLIDVNLPKYFGFFHSEDFEFVIDINGKWPDRDIWNYALENDLVIVTKDTDFYHKCLLDDSHVKVVFLKLGNLLLKELHAFFNDNWQQIVSHLPHAKMIIASQTSIDVIGID